MSPRAEIHNLRLPPGQFMQLSVAPFVCVPKGLRQHAYRVIGWSGAQVQS